MARSFVCGTPVAVALARYEALRIDRITQVIRKSAENGRRSPNTTLSALQR